MGYLTYGLIEDELASAVVTWPAAVAPLIHVSGSDSLSACAFSPGCAAAWANAFRSVVSSDAGSPAGAGHRSLRAESDPKGS